MSSLVHAALAVRKTAKGHLATIVSVLLGIAIALGWVSSHIDAFSTWAGVGFSILWLAVFGTTLYRRWRRDPDHLTKVDFEMGLLLVVGAHGAVQLAGGLHGQLYPLVYLLVACLAAFSGGPIGAVLAGVSVAFEAVLFFVTEPGGSSETFLAHAGFIAVFAALNLVFTRVEIARVRENSRRERNEEKQRIDEESRLFRLVTVPTSGASKDDERLFRSSLDEVHNALYHHLEMLKKTLNLHTCVLLFLDERRTKLRIVELVTSSEDVGTGPFTVGAGAVGAVASRGLVMNLSDLKPGYRGLCYYQEPSLVKSFLGVPVMEDGQLRGALCADRLDGRAFTARDEELLSLTVAQILRIMQNERIFVQLEKSKHEQHILYRASQSLGAALTEEQVMEAGLAAAAEVVPYDFAAITVYDRQSRKHTVRRAVGVREDELTGLTFKDNSSLTAMAVKNKHYLPYRGEFDARQQMVFTKRTNMTGMQSALVMPLVVREEAQGTLVLASRERNVFDESVRQTLQVLANQLSVSQANAAAVKRLEEMATTDGLTGCLNKRTFLEEMESKMRAAERFGRTLSLIVTDIDHFKSVNDTYGHATGDVVIKGLGQLLRRVKRETDIVARFGGEEFCVLCEETDTEGAVNLAERLREELQAMVFPTDMGGLSVTCSLGVATFPSEAGTAAELFEAADRALYAAKNNGRNQVCWAQDQAA